MLRGSVRFSGLRPDSGNYVVISDPGKTRTTMGELSHNVVHSVQRAAAGHLGRKTGQVG